MGYEDMTKEELMQALAAAEAKNKSLEAKIEKTEPKTARKSFSVRPSRAKYFDELAHAAGVSGSVLFETWVEEKYRELKGEV